MGIIGEFKEFIARGNVVDLAVGVIMGAAFGKIVDSLVKDIIMPPIGYLIGGVDFSSLALTLPAMTVPDPTDSTKPGVELAAVTINYGTFLNATISFLIVAMAVFLLVKGINSLRRKKKDEPVAAPTTQEKLLMEIRDLLKTNGRAGTSS